jgi:hypothetical protein
LLLLLLLVMSVTWQHVILQLQTLLLQIVAVSVLRSYFMPVFFSIPAPA